MAETNPFPLLSVIDTARIVRELEQALDDHRDWIKALVAEMVCRTKPNPADLEPDAHRKGQFSHWFSNEINPHLNDHPDFARVVELFEVMHEEARQLQLLIKDGKDISPNQYQHFLNSSDMFVRQLRALHTDARSLLSDTDPLTGVATRQAMYARLEQEQQRSKRSGQPSSIVMADVDRFKEVNDTYGHLAGDKVLQAFAHYLLDHLRPYDQVYRYGGEEFVLLLPNATPEQAKRIIERVRRGLMNQRTRIGNGSVVQITASFGITQLIYDISSKTAIEYADRAMYESKRSGRNRLRIWEETLDKSNKEKSKKTASL
ncbi:MAG: diguanylate cyclase [Rhodospirillaceae bacterium]|jgi:diguanylate cyclase (GGDEF)-like protein